MSVLRKDELVSLMSFSAKERYQANEVKAAREKAEKQERKRKQQDESSKREQQRIEGKVAFKMCKDSCRPYFSHLAKRQMTRRAADNARKLAKSKVMKTCGIVARERAIKCALNAAANLPALPCVSCKEHAAAKTCSFQKCRVCCSPSATGGNDAPVCDDWRHRTSKNVLRGLKCTKGRPRRAMDALARKDANEEAGLEKKKRRLLAGTYRNGKGLRVKPQRDKKGGGVQKEKAAFALGKALRGVYTKTETQRS